ncbi:putative Pre-mRNA-splicing factor cwc24, partial [Aulographum hederae CBS 113979]
DTAATADVPVVFKKRSAKSKANMRKRPATPPPASDSDEDYSSQDEAGARQIKRRRKNPVIAASSNGGSKTTTDLSSTHYAADRSTVIAPSNDATKQSNWYDEEATDAFSERNLLGKTRTKPSTDLTTTAEDAPSGTYKGAANYSNFIQKNPNAPAKKIMGPQKASTNVRMITLTDYAPDVCKDYKQTGFCGFGDSCKFLHAREDYAQGWALDRDWEVSGGAKKGPTVVGSANRTGSKDDAGENEADAKMLDKIPFACVICKKDYTRPVVTKCGHYFCESCALQRYRKKPDCVVCGAGTGGTFSKAKNLQKLLDRKKERAERLKAEGEDVEG